MAVTYGYYRSDGIQNSGTAIRRRNGANENVEIYNSSGKIYPREKSETIYSGSFGGFTLRTYRTIGGNRQGVAYQGAKSVSKTDLRVRVCYGHIKPSSIPRYDTLVAVDYVKIGFQAHSCGQHNVDRTLIFRVATNSNDIPEMKEEFKYVMGAGTDKSYHEVESNANNNLTNLIYTFLKEGQELILNNGETTIDKNTSYFDGSGYGSRNYASIESFEIKEIRLRYRP